MEITSMQIFEEMKKGNAVRVKQAKEEGRKVVGTYCTFAPEELILAAGAIPIGLCGTKEEPIPAAEEVLPRNLCPLIKSSYGHIAHTVFGNKNRLTLPATKLRDFISVVP